MVRRGAREASRGLIDEVELEPAGNQLRIILNGSLAGILRLAQENKFSWLRGGI
jgi:hypothetical protein